MPKFKTKSSWKKRVRFTATGKIKRGKAYRSHLLNSKTTKRKRQLRKSALAHVSNAITIKAMIPYKRKGRR
ncbi:MAG: 50S ribosomal protein L35 [Clostridiales bacterium]|nr:50S ribosomal protein L35 [Clostridiales bacterium]